MRSVRVSANVSVSVSTNANLVRKRCMQIAVGQVAN